MVIIANIYMRLQTLFLAIIGILLPSLKVNGQDNRWDQLLTLPETYLIYYSNEQLEIDGRANEASWQFAPWTDYFQDIEGSSRPKPRYQTRAKMLWDSTFLYIYAELEEPHTWADLRQHDNIVFHNNDFEVFISKEEYGSSYYEYEVNALGTIFDLFLPKPYRNGGSANIPWNFAGIRSAVHVYGTLNDPNDADSCWTVEIAIPFQSISLENDGKTPPEGSIWRLNFSRVQWQHSIDEGRYKRIVNENGKLIPEDNWVWSPQGIIDMHYPERWGYVKFSSQLVREGLPSTFEIPRKEATKRMAWLVYYLEQEHKKQYGSYTSSIDELINLYPGLRHFKESVNEIATHLEGFNAKISEQGGTNAFSINHLGELSPIN